MNQEYHKREGNGDRGTRKGSRGHGRRNYSGRGGRGRGGRGRGKASGGGANGSRNIPVVGRMQKEKHHEKSLPKKRQTLVPNTKKNGEKGADVHTVSERVRIEFTRILMTFREDEKQSRYEFPPDLTNTERKFLHQLAGQLGLTSKSTGKGEKRRIAVTKRVEKIKTTSHGDDGMDLPVLKIGNEGAKALQIHLSKFPPTHVEEIESRETGASLVEAMTQQQRDTVIAANGDAEVLEALDRLELDRTNTAFGNLSNEIRNPNVGRRVDVARRMDRHAFYQRQKEESKDYQQILENRSKLPAFRRQAEVVATVKANPVTVIQGETGCGKSTQCPQFILDANPSASIAVTQPRRISAISIAERVAQEQCLSSSSSGSSDGIGSLVGYQVRLEVANSKDTQLLFLTPGVLLRKLQSSPMLSEYTHIIIDEVHERDKYTEFLLIRLRDLLPLRPDLRVILMSATLQTEVLMSYFAPDSNTDCNLNINDDFYLAHPPAMLSIEGRTFPVQEFFLEHVLELTEYVDIDAFEDDDGENRSRSIAQKPTMSSGQLDAALYKFLSNSGTQVTSCTKVASMELTVRCALCGKGFSDGIELGEHIAICTGSNDTIIEDTIVSSEEATARTATFANLGLGHDKDDANNFYFASEDFEEYAEYDVDAKQEVADYAFHEVSGFLSEQEVREENDAGKWDGEGLFHADVEQESNLTAKQEKYLKCYQTMYDDSQINTELLIEVLHYINKTSRGEGAILVFLPGWQEISEVSMLLEDTVPFCNRSKFMILPLHSGIPSQDQRKVLRRPPPGTRKVVLSTNIAETSLTINDVAFVIDTGRAKEKDYDPHLKTSTLQPVWISQSSSKQRKGRAGRTKAGVCFHLFSSRRHQSMRPFVESELLRTPLEEMCLMTKKLGLAPGGPEDIDGIPAFLSKAITPPHAKSISNALELLVNLGAMLPETNDLTTLGESLSVLSLEPRVGKMVIWSYLLGCTKVASQMAVAMAYKSPFVLPPPHMRREAEKSQLILSEKSESDQVTVLNAILKRDQLKRKREEAYRAWCRQNFLSPSSLQMIGDLRKNLSRELSSLGFADPKGGGYQNRHNKNHALWQAAIAAGLYPNIATRRQGDVNFSTMTNRKAKIHVSSVNALKGQPLNSKCQVPKGEIEFVCFGEMVKGSHFFTLSQTTHLPSVLPILLLCGTSLSIHPDGDDEMKQSILNLDDWIIFKCRTDVASRLVILRKRLESAFWTVLSKPSRDPKETLTSIEHDAIETLAVVLSSALKSSGVR